MFVKSKRTRTRAEREGGWNRGAAAAAAKGYTGRIAIKGTLVTSDPSKSDITSMFSWITLVILLLLFLLNTRRRIPTLTKDSNSG
jgi:hypothetical protein